MCNGVTTAKIYLTKNLIKLEDFYVNILIFIFIFGFVLIKSKFSRIHDRSIYYVILSEFYQCL